ncbi:MAG: hypothetical protein U5Q16_04125 [Gammaproteobacteria bacterium]|nr:hypothetical protein [Gammaproteobacteria bacterium]
MKFLSGTALLRLTVVSAAAFYGFAFAQEDESLESQVVPGQTAEPEDYQSGPVEQIVVTGSRIRRDEFSSSAPIQVITSEKSALAGLLNAGEILQNSSVASGQQVDDSFSGFVTDGGPGAYEISLRGLGGAALRWSSSTASAGPPSGVRGATNSGGPVGHPRRYHQPLRDPQRRRLVDLRRRRRGRCGERHHPDRHRRLRAWTSPTGSRSSSRATSTSSTASGARPATTGAVAGGAQLDTKQDRDLADSDVG